MKEKIIFGIGGLAVGFVLGFILGKFTHKKEEVQEQEKVESESEISEESKEAVKEIIDKEGYKESSEPDTETEKLNKEYEDYKKMKGDKIEVLGNNPFDKKYPDISYEQEALDYFVYDDLLTDEEGQAVDEDELIGTKLRQFNWYNGDSDHVWVRNNKEEKDYLVQKFDCAYEDHFGHEYPDFPTEDDDYDET